MHACTFPALLRLEVNTFLYTFTAAKLFTERNITMPIPVADSLLGLKFRIPPETRRAFSSDVVCCQLEVSARDRSVGQRFSTK